MHRWNKRSGLGESFSGSESSNNNRSYPLCPKPRRIQPASQMPEFLINPIPCSKHKSEQKLGILNLIPDNNNNNNKKGAGDQCRERSEVCSCCCWSYGSPPRRTENPLVQDVRFIKEQMDLISHQFGFASTASATHV
ncbi:hypothetical protein LINGRAHAP2_LOCUS31111 [Linum grandiflorum]